MTTWKPDPTKIITAEQKAQTVAASEAKVARREAFKAASDVVSLRNRLASATPEQIDSYIDSNVTTIAKAREVLKAVLKVLATELRNED